MNGKDGQSPYQNNATVNVSQEHDNTDQELIHVTRDRLHNILLRNARSLEGNKAWIAPAGIATSILLTFVSADFQLKFGFSADTWRAIFAVLLALSVGWLIMTILRRKKACSLEELLDKIQGKHKE